MNKIEIEKVLDTTLNAFKLSLLKRVGFDQKVCTLHILGGKVNVPQKKSGKGKL